MTLRKQTFSGVRWTTFSSLGRTFLQMAQISILARLLTPADFGLVALVTSIMVFLQIFADAGISNAIIHYKDISQNQLSSLYWLNVGVSLCLALLLAAFSPWVATWYGQPQMKLLLLLAGCTLVMGASAQQIRIVAQKNLRFAELSKIELSAACIGFIVAVTAAYNDAGVYSIVAGNLATATIGSVLVWYRLAGGWRPVYCFNIQEIRHFLAFGAYMIANNLANTFNSQIDIMLGGKILGSHAIGLYSIPRDLNMRIANAFNPIVTNVGLPVMAKAQNDFAMLKRVYLQTMRMTASVNFPIYVALALFAPEIVHILLGTRWEEAIPLLRIFSVWGLIRSIGNPVGSLLMALGRADLSFKWNVVWLFIMPPAVWMGSHFGIEGMAFAMVVMVALGFAPNWYFLVWPLCGARLGEYSLQLSVPLGLTLMAALAGYICAGSLVGDFIRLAVGIVASGLFYAVLSYYFNRVWADAMLELLGKRLDRKQVG
jgi:O-antigen/teichoic acid export membrane protein